MHASIVECISQRQEWLALQPESPRGVGKADHRRRMRTATQVQHRAPDAGHAMKMKPCRSLK
jgi:hypothetical protein